MIIRKIVAVVGTVGIVGAALLVPVQAQTPTPTSQNPFASFVGFLSQKLGLDKSQVQSAVTQFKQQNQQQRQQNMQQRVEDRLAKLVQQGKITDAQKQAILTELANLRVKYNPDNLKNLTPDQRKQQMQAMRQELQDWAKSQNIDPKYLMMFGRGPMMRKGWGM